MADTTTVHEQVEKLRNAYEALPSTPKHKHSGFFSYVAHDMMSLAREGKNKELEEHYQFLQQTVQTASQYDNPKLLCDTVSFFWNILRYTIHITDSSQITYYTRDVNPQVMKNLDKTIASFKDDRLGIYYTTTSMDYRVYFFYKNYQQARTLNSDVSFMDVVTYYKNLVKKKNTFLDKIHDGTSNHVSYYVENILAACKPELRNPLYYEHLESLWVHLFTTPDGDGKRYVGPKYILDWESHPNWGLFTSIANNKLVPEVSSPNIEVNVSFVVDKILPSIAHVDHLFWFIDKCEHTEFMSNYFSDMNYFDILEWAYKSIHNIPCQDIIQLRKYIDLFHRLFSTWANVTTASDEGAKADVTIMVLDFLGKIQFHSGYVYNMGYTPGNILLMLHELPQDLLQLPKMAYTTMVDAYCDDVSTLLNFQE